MNNFGEGLIGFIDSPAYSAPCDRRSFLAVSLGGLASLLTTSADAGKGKINFQDAVSDHTKRQAYLDNLLIGFAKDQNINKKGIEIKYHHTPISFFDSLLLEGVIDYFPEFRNETDKEDPAMFPAIGDFLGVGRSYGFVDYQKIVPSSIGKGYKQAIHALPDLFLKSKKDADTIMMLNFCFAKGCRDGYHDGTSDLRESLFAPQINFIAIDAFDTTLSYSKKGEGELSGDIVTVCEIGLVNHSTSLGLLLSLSLLKENEASAYTRILQRVGSERIMQLRDKYNGNKDLMDDPFREMKEPKNDVPDVVPKNQSYLV